MSFFFSCLFSTLQLRLRDIRSWLVVLLLPALVLASGWLLPAQEVSSPVQVGVVLPEDGAEEMWSLLESRSDQVLTFILTDIDTLDRNIAAGRWDCGIVLAEDFDYRVTRLELDRIIALRIGAGSAVYPLVRETVSACMAQLVSPEIAREYLLDSGIANEDTIRGMQSRLEERLDESDRIIVSLSTPDGKPLSPVELAQEGMDSVLCWMVSVVILVRLLLGATDLGRWIDMPATLRLKPLRSATCLMAARIGADGMLVMLSGCAAILLLGRGLWGCAAVVSYGLFWMSFGILLAHLKPVAAVLPVCVPFAAVVSLLLSSALVDISLILPELSMESRWIPAAMFLRICTGDMPACGILLAAAAASLLVSSVIDKLRAAINSMIKRRTAQ